MSTGNWALLHEYAIYQYMMERFQEKRLKLHPVYLNGTPYTRTKYYIDVNKLDTITDTKFPDIKGICIFGVNNNNKVPAEVKYKSSFFDYHKNPKNKETYSEFKKQGGCLIVYKHDAWPHKLYSDYKIDIFELNQEDFIIFVKENFDRLFHEQIQDQNNSNIWMFYQGREKNFNKGYGDILPARDSGLWSPKRIISPFQLTIGDKALFIKTKGIKGQDLRNFYDCNKIYSPLWNLEEIFIAKITSPILTRDEFYHSNKKFPYGSPLWGDEIKSNKILYGFVFKFEEENIFSNLNINLQDFSKNNKKFVDNLYKLFIWQKEVQITKDDYLNVIENLIAYKNKA